MIIDHSLRENAKREQGVDRDENVSCLANVSQAYERQCRYHWCRRRLAAAAILYVGLTHHLPSCYFSSQFLLSFSRCLSRLRRNHEASSITADFLQLHLQSVIPRSPAGEFSVGSSKIRTSEKLVSAVLCTLVVILS